MKVILGLDMAVPISPWRFSGGSRYLIIQESGLKDHDDCGFWGLRPLGLVLNPNPIGPSTQI